MNGSAHAQQENKNEERQSNNELMGTDKSHGQMICPILLNVDMKWPDHAEVKRHPGVGEDASEDYRVICVRTMIMYWISERARVRSQYHFSIQSICVALCVVEQIPSAH